MLNMIRAFLRRYGWIRLSATLIVVALLAGELIIHRHTIFAIEALPFFYPIFGFVAFLLVVGGGVLLRHFVARSEDYYDD